MKNFNDLPWHDAEIISIYIDRNDPGTRDIVEFAIKWPDNSRSVLQFYDCYHFLIKMNFGVVAPESVMSAQEILFSDELETIRSKWVHSGIDIDRLVEYKINTNSTNSEIILICMGFIFIEKEIRGI